MPDLPPQTLDGLREIMARLRDPDGGCPWDLEQTYATIAPFTLEEAYEVADAIDRSDWRDLRDELGDLLFQVIFHARIAEERGDFTFDDVVAAISDKLIRRHPHVFGAPDGRSAAEHVASWETLKASERHQKQRTRVLDDVPLALPALSRAAKLTRRAASVGFDWSEPAQVVAKLREELEELEVEIAAGDLQKSQDEIGDLFFVVVNLARKLHLDPEEALRGANAKFIRRFSYIEDQLTAQGTTPDAASLDEMETLWAEAKSKGL